MSHAPSSQVAGPVGPIEIGPDSDTTVDVVIVAAGNSAPTINAFPYLFSLYGGGFAPSVLGTAVIDSLYQASLPSNPNPSNSIQHVKQGFTYGEQVVKAARFTAVSEIGAPIQPAAAVYALGDVIGDAGSGAGNLALNFSRFLYIDGTPVKRYLKQGRLTGMKAFIEPNPVIDPAFDVFVWYSQPEQTGTDNTPFAPSDNDLALRLMGVARFLATDAIDCGTQLVYIKTDLDIHFNEWSNVAYSSNLDTTDTDPALWLTVVTRTVWTPILNTNFRLTFFGELD